MLDVIAVLLVAPVVLALVMVLTALVATGGGRPFFVQERLGRGGRVYRMWKLRSMLPDAEARLTRLLEADPAAREEWDRNQKLRDDPRVTPFGRILRQSSLDELPQLWNVLVGDMSLVGPRPMLPQQRMLYPGNAYTHMRPGITGLWQVSGRHTTSFVDRARFDGEYHDRLSLATDIRILLATVRVVLRGTGC